MENMSNFNNPSPSQENILNNIEKKREFREVLDSLIENYKQLERNTKSAIKQLLGVTKITDMHKEIDKISKLVSNDQPLETNQQNAWVLMTLTQETKQLTQELEKAIIHPNFLTIYNQKGMIIYSPNMHIDNQTYFSLATYKTKINNLISRLSNNKDFETIYQLLQKEIATNCKQLTDLISTGEIEKEDTI